MRKEMPAVIHNMLLDMKEQREIKRRRRELEEKAMRIMLAYPEPLIIAYPAELDEA